MNRPDWRARARSFVYALRGVRILLSTEPNARVHLAATLIVVGLGAYFPFSRADWCWVTIALTAVWVAEALNTAIECLGDALSPDFNPHIGRAKDVAAGAVLMAAAGALVVGALVILPHLASSG
ncbi:MAG: diacylglycerol kinase family protein [Betaproteobacteria bacterium]|nr:diacylglycerol kinase family protein [Betaproteobacteria bacterium]